MKRGAVILIENGDVYLKIAEIKNQDINILEDQRSSLKPGRDLLKRNKNKCQVVKELCAIIKYYSRIVQEYKVEAVKVVAGGGVGEVLVKDFVQNLIKEKTGFNVDILDEFQEKNYMFQTIINKFRNNISVRDNEVLISYLSADRLAIGIIAREKVIGCRNFKIDSFKMSEILNDIKGKTQDFHKVIKDNFSGLTNALKIFFEKHQLNCLLASGRGIKLIAKLCNLRHGRNFYNIPGVKLSSLFKQIKGKTVEQLEGIYKMSTNDAEIILPVVVILRTLVKLSAVKKIITPVVDMEDILIYKMLFPDKFKAERKHFIKGAIFSARNIGERYKYNRVHGSLVSEFSISIFEELTKKYSFNKKDGLLLEVAAVLHDSGKFLSIENHSRYSYEIIRNSDITGLKKREIILTACIAKLHSGQNEEINDYDFKELTLPERIRVAKLTAILRIADALNKSHYNKFNQLKLELNENELQIRVHTNKETVLEKSVIEKKARLFEKVFALKPVLKSKMIF